jgi:predicted Ser/Thr protein kinase
MGSSSSDDPTRPTTSSPAGRADEPTHVQSNQGSEPGTAPTISAGDFAQATPATGDLLTGQVWGDFQVGTLLGRGGMGAVYRGRQRSLDRDVAIKVLPPHLSDNEGFRNRFQLEAKAVAQLDSPHIIKVYGAGEANGHHYFAMEYVEGQDLSQAVRRLGKPTRAQALDWVLQAARGLQAAGELGIVHRDIKPANMMLTRKGVVKLMDFGLVRSTKDNHGLTMTGTVMGTVSYFSPEQGRGERCDVRTDLYALGVVLYEFLTGRLPFTGEDPTSIIYQHIHVAPTPPREIDPEIPEEQQSVCLKCLQKRVEDRYETAAELVADLERLIRGEKPAISAAELGRLRHGTTWYVPGREAGRSRLAPWVLGGTAVTIAAAAAIWLGRAAPATAPAVPSPTATAPTAVTEPVSVQPAPTATAAAAISLRPAANPAPAAGSVIQVPEERTATHSPQTALAPAPAPVAVRLPVSALASEVQTLLGNGRYAEARALVANHPEDPAAAAMAAAINRSEGAALLNQTRNALTAGQLIDAANALRSARAVIGNAAEVVALEKDLAARELRLQNLLASARREAAAGNAEAARTALDTAASEAPGLPQIAETAVAVQAELGRIREARAARDRACAEGRTSLAKLDFDLADATFASVLASDPQHQGALDGRAQSIAKRQEIAALAAQIEASIANRELAAATRDLQLLVAAAPSLPTTARARAHVDELAALLADEARQAAELEAHRSALAQALLAETADLQVPVAQLEQELAEFVAIAGAQRPELADIRARIAVRTQRDAVAARLGELDAAVLGGDSQRINAIVSEPGLATALAALKDQPGLVFVSTLAAFTPSGDTAAATLTVRHALASYPETVLTYRLQLRRTASGWTITAATRQE